MANAQTVSAQLAPASIGPRLKAARDARGLSLRELARRVGVSPSLVSQIENGRGAPSVNTLYSLVTELEISVDMLFSDESDLTGNSGRRSGGALEERSAGPQIERASSRKVITLDSHVRWERLTPRHDEAVDFLYVVYEVGGQSGQAGSMMRHQGKEYGIVLEGRLGVAIAFEEYDLGAGDSISFDSTTPHRLWNAGDVAVKAIWFVIGRGGDARTPRHD